MGLGTNFAPIIFELLGKLENRNAILTLGRVTLDFDAAKANAMLESAGFGCPISPTATFDDKTLFAAMGFTEVDSLDVSDFEGATHIFDLNSRPLSAAMRERYDVVFNAGTLEHVFRIDCGLANCIEMLRPGGRILSVAPMNNYVDHGFYQLSPTLFFDFAFANGLTVEAAFEVETILHAGQKQTRSIIRSVHPGDFGQVGLLNANPRLFVSMLRKGSGATSDKAPIQAYYRKVFGEEAGAGGAAGPERRSMTVVDGLVQSGAHGTVDQFGLQLTDLSAITHISLANNAMRRGPYGGAQWIIDLPKDIEPGDKGHPMSSGLRLFEDGRELMFRHCGHQEIADRGEGRFSHWGSTLYFSTSDNSDPTKNDRRYTVFWDGALHRSLVGTVKLDVAPPSTGHEMFEISLSGPVAPPFNNFPALLTQIRNLSEHHLEETAQFYLAEALAHAAYPRFRFSEFGRSFLTNDNLFWNDYTRFMDHGNWHSHDRKYTLKELLKLTRHVAGHYAECGVYTGGSAHLLCREANTQGRRVHLFDSFEGLSQPGPNDGSYWQAGRLAVSAEAVSAALSEWDCFDLFKGWIPDAFPMVGDTRYAFVHLDLDLEAPTRDSLNFFVPRMDSGGIVVLDDYGFDSCPGVKRAADDFFSNRPEEIVMLATGQAFVIIR